jgi:hypothetical protein
VRRFSLWGNMIERVRCRGEVEVREQAENAGTAKARISTHSNVFSVALKT